MNDLLSAIVRILPFVVLLLVFSNRLKRGKISADALDLHGPTGHFWAWWLGFLAFALAVEFGLSAYGLLESRPWKARPLPSVLLIFGAVVLAPVAEEILFRGIFLNKLLAVFSKKWAAVLLQALVFVAVHNYAYEGTLVSKIGIAQTFVDACLYAVARWHTRSLATPVAMHATGNLIATLERFLV